MLTGDMQMGHSQLADDLHDELWVDDARRAFGVVLGVMLAFSSSGTPMLLLRATRIQQGHGLNARATFERLLCITPRRPTYSTAQPPLRFCVCVYVYVRVSTLSTQPCASRRL